MRMNALPSMPILSLWVALSLHVQGVDGWAATAWREPVPVEGVNTLYHEKAPFLSFDGLTLYFGRQDVGGGQYTRLYEAKRLSAYDVFRTPAQIIPLAYSDAHVSSPWVSADNLRMYYYVAGVGKNLFVATRSSPSEPWWPGLAINELNLTGDVVTPTLTEDERTIVFGGIYIPGGRGDYDLWMAERSSRNSRFGRPWNLETLNTSAADIHPSLTPDGLTLYFMSRRNGPSQIFVARRPSRSAPFGAPEHLEVFDTPNGASEFPSITADGKALYFGRWPTGGTMDIYVSYAGYAYYVDAIHGSDTRSGRTPETAFATIQRAIDVAQDGDEVLLCPGIYRGPVRFLGKAITVRSLGDAAIIEAAGQTAVIFDMGEGPDSVLRNVIIRNSHIGIDCIHSGPTVVNVTIAGNEHATRPTPALVRPDPRPSISNSILCANVYNNASGFDVTYCCVEIPRRDGITPWGAGNFSADPLFVDPANGDYHVRSEHGRYWADHGVWVVDDVTSPCIDAGDPAADFSAERKPNGGRLNVGAHGGTAYAEMSDMPFDGDVNGDGVFDNSDYEAFMILWEQRRQSEPPSVPKRR